MHLWTEYEGNTLAGYPVHHLSRSEGRSAFFTTTDPEGQPALLRLTESHFDEGELVGRWQMVAAVSHANLQAIRGFGQTSFDQVDLAFCVTEAVDGSLADVLRERQLSTDEAAEVAEAVAGALATLHAAELIHGHVDATNVFAVREVVKLRSDCARECRGDFESDTAEAREALRQRDVHDLGLLLRRCLVPQWQEATAMPLPSPFDRIVRRALNGTVSAEGIAAEFAAALKPDTLSAPAQAPPAATAQPVYRPTLAGTGVDAKSSQDFAAATRRKIVSGTATRGTATVDAAQERAFAAPALADVAGQAGTAERRAAATMPSHTSTARITHADEEGTLPTFSARRSKSSTAHRFRFGELRIRSRHNTGTAPLSGDILERLKSLLPALARHKAWIASGAIAAVGFIAWNAAREHQATSQPHPAISGAAVPKPQPDALPAQPLGAPPKPATVTVSRPVQRSLVGSGITSSARAGWHVIAYTYNYQQQAHAKAVELKQRYVALQPQVFSPTGRAPYFVALGGSSDAASALALRNRARHAGLPRDTYARNF